MGRVGPEGETEKMATGSGTGLGFGTLATGAGFAGVVGVVVAGVLIYQVAFAPGPDDTPPPPTPVAQEAEPSAPSSGDDAGPSVAETAPSSPPPAEEPSVPVAPSFDLVRIDAAGGALIAGQSEALADLRLLLDGEEIHVASSDAGGAFVAMFQILPSDRPRVLSLEMIRQDGSPLVSGQSVIISPTLRPAQQPERQVVSEAPSAGPETPVDSGLTDLALAEGEDPVPAGSVTAPGPVAPDLPDTPPAGASSPDTEAPDILAPDALAPDAGDAATELAALTTLPGNDPATRGLSPSSAAAGAPPAGAVEIPDATGDTALAPSATDAPAPTQDTAPDREDAPQIAGTEEAPAPAAGPAADDPAVPDLLTTTPSGGAPSPGETTGPDIDVAQAPSAVPPRPQAAGDAIIAEAPAAGDGAAELPTLQATAPDPATPAPAPAPSGAGQAPAGEAAVHRAARDDPAGPAGPAVPATPTGTDAIDRTDPPQAPTVEARTPTVLLADGDGIRVIQTGDAAGAQRRISLDTIAYDTEGDVQLAGRGSAEADVRFYLDNQPIQVARIDLAGSWRTRLPQVDPGTYTLRLDELTPAGLVQSRIETPFLREEPETVAAVTAQGGENVITVQWGNTLWGIAQQQLGEGVAYVQIFEANRDQIRNPDLIYPGQIFTIPDAD